MALSPRPLTRRAFVCSAAAPLLAEGGKGVQYPAEWVRYKDPATELLVLRVTDPSYSSRLPAPYQRAVARRNALLLFANDRSGSFQAYRMDPKTGVSRQLTAARALDPASLTLAPDDRGFYWFDGPSLHHASFSNLRDREIYRVPDGWERCQGGRWRTTAPSRCSRSGARASRGCGWSG